MNAFRDLDDRLLLAVNSLAVHTPGWHGIALAWARYGVLFFAALLLAGLVAARHGPSRALAATGWAAVATVLALGLNQPLGALVAEPRPYVTHPAMLRLADATTDFSFPSDHAVMAGAVAAGLLLAHRRLGLIAVGAAVLMALTRVYVGAHYPWDVLAGLVFGAAVALLGWSLLHRPLTSLTAWLRDRPLWRGALAEHEAAPEAVHTGARPGPTQTPVP